jgi:hypothetical protein
MPKTRATAYKRLPGRGFRRKGFLPITRVSCTLWLAKDHLLSVDNRVFSESYKRFYFRDIQAIIVQRTNRGKVWNGILATLAGFAMVGALSFKRYQTLPFWILCGLFLAIWLVNWFLGPTCRCDMITAVQRETLPSLDRLKTVEKVLPNLRRLIEQTQGEIALKDIRE